MRCLIPLALMLSLAGCVATGGVQIGTGPDAFRIAAPAGYCLAEGAVARQRGSDFAAFIPCAPGGTATGVLSATVGTAGSAQPVDPQAMAAFLASPPRTPRAQPGARCGVGDGASGAGRRWRDPGADD